MTATLSVERPVGATPRAGHWTGTTPLLRAALRRDRVRIASWSVGLAVVAVSVAGTWDRLYPTVAGRLQLAAELSASPSLTALLGPLFRPESTGGLTAWRVGAGLAFALGLVNVFLVVRHTRAEEQDGQAELVRSGVVGRLAPLAVALGVAVVLDGAFGLLVAGLLGGKGYGWAGAVAFGSTIGATAFVFAGVAAIAAQLARTSRGANGLGSAVVAATFALAAFANASVPPRGLVWLSPLGWVEQTRAYAGERWWVVGLELVVAAALVGVGLRMAAGRDLGDGLLPARRGRDRAAAWVRSPVTLAWRLDRAALLAWGLGLVALGALVGSLVKSGVDLVESNPQLADFIRRLGSSSASVADAYVIAMVTFFGLAASAYGVSEVLRLHTDEAAGRTELALSLPVSRLAWAGARLVVAAVGVLLLMGLGGLAIGLVYGAAVGDVGGQALRDAGAALVLVPAAWVLVAFALAVVGLAPRLVWLAWLALTWCIVVGELGPILGIPDWLQRATPFWFAPHWPAEPLTATALVVLLLLAGALAAAGLVGLRRRDVPA